MGSGEGVEEEERGGGGVAADTPTHLRELLKTEREQKVKKFTGLKFLMNVYFSWANKKILYLKICSITLTVSNFLQNYFEELVSVRDKQLARLQLELTTAGEEREKERTELEVVIIELQQQL